MAGAWGFAPFLRDHVLAAFAAAHLQRSTVPTDALDRARPGETTVYLVVGSDRRDPAAGSDQGVQGERADAIMLWAVPITGTVTALSLPRDLRVHVPGHGDSKLHGVLAYGPEALVAAVRALTGIPVHRYVEVEFSALTRVVDGIGGVLVTVPFAARDPAVGLDLSGGTQRLDGATALAYVRSRHYEERTPAGWVTTAPGDLGRIDRQHGLLHALFEQASSRCASLNCLAVLRDFGASLTVDPGLDGADVRHIMTALGEADTEIRTVTVPTRPERPADDSLSPFPPAHLGSLGFRVLDQPAAGELFRRLRQDVTGGAGTP